MSMVDYVFVMLAGTAKHTLAKLVLGTEDVALAVRKVPLLDSQVSVSISITGVYISHTQDRLNASNSLDNLSGQRLQFQTFTGQLNG